MSSKKIHIEKNRRMVQKCPICKNKKLLTVHHILPKYIFKEIKTSERNYFLNGKNTYWLCSRCHSNYEKKYANRLKAALSEIFEFPQKAEARVIRVRELAKIKNLCRYMTGKYKKNKYNYSIYQAYNFVIQFYNKKYMAYDEIENMSIMRDTIDNPDFIDLGIFFLYKTAVRELDYFYRRNFLEFLKDKKVRKGNFIPEINEHYEI